MGIEMGFAKYCAVRPRQLAAGNGESFLGHMCTARPPQTVTGKAGNDQCSHQTIPPHGGLALLNPIAIVMQTGSKNRQLSMQWGEGARYCTLGIKVHFKMLMLLVRDSTCLLRKT